jgi:gliding motility-associated-like protein
MCSKLIIRAILLLLHLFTHAAIQGQAFPEYNMGNGTITSCQGILYDSGGPTGPYSHNENNVVVIAAGGVITATFQGFFQLENNNDFLRLYNGSSTAAPLLGQFTGTSVPAPVVANSGSLTVEMVTNGSIAFGGFKMQWTSVQPMPTTPSVSVPAAPACGSSQLNLQLSSMVNCDWLSTASVTLFVGGEPIHSSDLVGNCNGNGMTNQLTATFPVPFSSNCAYSLQLNISIPDNCGVLYPYVISSSFNLSGCAIDAQVSSVDSELCKGECTTLEAHVIGCYAYTYNWSHGLPATAGPHNVCPTTTTTYTVTVTEQPSGLTVTRQHTIVVNDLQVLTPAQTVCQSADDIVLQATLAGTWSGPGIVAGTNVFRPDSADEGINTIYVEALGCIDSVDIEVLPIQTENVTAGCPGSDPFQLVAEPTGGTWSGPHTTASGIFTPTELGEFEITYTLGTCSDVLTVHVQDIGGEFTLESICQSVPLYVIPFSPSGGIWSGPGIVNSSLGHFQPSLAPAGPLTLTYTIHGCVQTFHTTVKEISIGSGMVVTCPQQAPLVIATQPPVPTGGVWSGPGILVGATGLFNPTLIPSGTTSEVIYSAPNGCSDTILVQSVQTVIEEQTFMFCVNEPAFVLDDLSTVHVTPEGGLWSGPAVNAPGGVYQFHPSIAGPGQHTLTYTTNGCTDQLIMRVYPTDLPDDPFHFCSNEGPGQLVPSLAPGGTWTGSGIVDAEQGIFHPGLAEPGSYYVYWTGPAGCQDSIFIVVEEYLEAAITGLESAYCYSHQQVDFVLSPVGGALTGSLNTTSFYVDELGVGNYEIQYVYTPAICPVTAAMQSFTIYEPLTATISAAPDTICAGNSVTVNVSASGGNPSAGYIYSWSNGGISQPTNISLPATSTVISVEVSDGCSEPVLLSVNVEVLPPIEWELTTSDPACPGEDGWLTATVTSGGDYSITWNGEEQSTVSGIAGSIHQLVITDLIYGCTLQQNVTIASLPFVNPDFAIHPATDCISSDLKDNITFIDVSQNGVSGSWNFGNGVTLPYVEGETIKQSYPGPGDYTVTLIVINADGCEGSVTKDICILAEDPLFIPDIFSPNGDGNNDVLYVRGFGLGRIEFVIYNRWGQEVFRSNDQRKGWDGTFNGQPATSGSYFYSFRGFAGETVLEKTGEIALIR